MLGELLGLNEPPTSGFAWHDEVTSGFPKNSVTATARWLGVSPDDVALLVENQEMARLAKSKGELLSPQASNYLYRIAVAANRLHGAIKDEAACARWLRSPQPSLRGRVPILLLGSHVGTEYVLAAIARVVADKFDKATAKKSSRAQSEAPDETALDEPLEG